MIKGAINRGLLSWILCVCKRVRDWIEASGFKERERGGNGGTEGRRGWERESPSFYQLHLPSLTWSYEASPGQSLLIASQWNNLSGDITSPVVPTMGPNCLLLVSPASHAYFWTSSLWSGGCKDLSGQSREHKFKQTTSSHQLRVEKQLSPKKKIVLFPKYEKLGAEEIQTTDRF